MKRVHGRLCYQLSIELLEDGTFVATAVRGGDSFEGRGNNHTEALEDLANELDEDGNQIVDIGLHMLQPRELFDAMGFPHDYIIDVEFNGRPMTKTLQIELVGNSVCPQVARALIEANVYERRERGRGCESCSK